MTLPRALTLLRFLLCWLELTDELMGKTSLPTLFMCCTKNAMPYFRIQEYHLPSIILDFGAWATKYEKCPLHPEYYKIKTLLPKVNPVASTLDPRPCSLLRASSPPSSEQSHNDQANSIISHLTKILVRSPLTPPTPLVIVTLFFSSPQSAFLRGFSALSPLSASPVYWLSTLQRLTSVSITQLKLLGTGHHLHVAKCNRHCAFLVFLSVLLVFKLTDTLPRNTFLFVPRMTHHPRFPLIHLCQISSSISLF